MDDLTKTSEALKVIYNASGIGWEGTFSDYLNIVRKNLAVTRNAFQRIYDMIISYGYKEYLDGKIKVIHYNFFDDPQNNGKDAVYGLDVALGRLVNTFQSASLGYGPEKRILLLHGPVGSAKSTIVRLFKKGLVDYTKTEKGALYSFMWKASDVYGSPERAEKLSPEDIWVPCPMHEEPLRLIPEEVRQEFLEKLNAGVVTEESLCPFCQYVFNKVMKKNDNDLNKLLEGVRIYRVIFSEKNRVGIGTFQPKDEKNQDSTELSGDMNYRKIAIFGSDSDPRAFNFDGEFEVANRGLVEFVEVLKLEVAFLYDLLGASQEHMIKPKKFSQTGIDEVIIGHTNEPEYKKLQSNEFMEALRDRTVKVDIPYITRLADEIKIYEKDYRQSRVKGKHVAPHTVEIASMWAVLTRLEEPKKAQLSLMQKLKLYNGKTLPGFTEDNIKELRVEASREGMEGISPRYIQDKISNALVSDESEKCINPFMVLNELEGGLDHHSLITNEDQKKKFKELISAVKLEYEDIVKNEVQRAISADDEAMKKLCGNYIDNIKAYTQKQKVKNKYTGKDEEPDERLMRAVEEKIDIPENRKDDFRREIMNYIGALAIDGVVFDYKANERLQKAIELKLFEDQKDTIKLTSLVSSVVDKSTQEKIDVVKDRLIKKMDYCEVCATDVLNFVASIFARGDLKGNK